MQQMMPNEEQSLTEETTTIRNTFNSLTVSYLTNFQIVLDELPDLALDELPDLALAAAERRGVVQSEDWPRHRRFPSIPVLLE
jgi:hypothetical protein